MLIITILIFTNLLPLSLFVYNSIFYTNFTTFGTQSTAHVNKFLQAATRLC